MPIRVDSINLSKTLRKADDFGIKTEDGQDLGHDGCGQANIHYSQDTKEMVHGRRLTLDGDQDEEIGTNS